MIDRIEIETGLTKERIEMTENSFNRMLNSKKQEFDSLNNTHLIGRKGEKLNVFLQSDNILIEGNDIVYCTKLGIREQVFSITKNNLVPSAKEVYDKLTKIAVINKIENDRMDVKFSITLKRDLFFSFDKILHRLTIVEDAECDIIWLNVASPINYQ